MRDGGTLSKSFQMALPAFIIQRVLRGELVVRLSAAFDELLFSGMDGTAGSSDFGSVSSNLTVLGQSP